MKVITGTKDDEVQIRQGEDLKTNLNSIPTGRALLLENPDGGLEELLIKLMKEIQTILNENGVYMIKWRGVLFIPQQMTM